ncbi:hypothetical protein F5141DRAFT_19208 [Pisolithus sp. B1]|nr:hypothetical protein F5141DRAFT_19208 [Pisolithus sp. B1]
MGVFYITRVIALVLSVVFSLIVVGLSAHLISLTEEYYALYFVFCALGIATAGLTISTVPVMYIPSMSPSRGSMLTSFFFLRLIIDVIRRGAFTSMVVVELVWLFVLWVLWVATAGEAVSAGNYYFPSGCVYDKYPTVNEACREIQAVEAFSFLAFFVLLGYTSVLLVFTCIAAARGNSLWLRSVKESTFLAPSSTAPPPQQPMDQYKGTPTPQYQVPVQQPQYAGAFGQPQYSGSPAPSQQPYYPPQAASV